MPEPLEQGEVLGIAVADDGTHVDVLALDDLGDCPRRCGCALETADEVQVKEPPMTIATAFGIKRVSATSVHQLQVESRIACESASSRSFTGSSTIRQFAPWPVSPPLTPAAITPPRAVMLHLFTAALSADTETPGKGQRGSNRKPRARREFASASSAA
jgi:hypothetical protein